MLPSPNRTGAGGIYLRVRALRRWFCAYWAVESLPISMTRQCVENDTRSELLGAYGVEFLYDPCCTSYDFPHAAYDENEHVQNAAIVSAACVLRLNPLGAALSPAMASTLTRTTARTSGGSPKWSLPP